MKIEQLVVNNCPGIEYLESDASLFVSYDQFKAMRAFTQDGAVVQSGSIELLGETYQCGQSFHNPFPRKVVWLSGEQPWAIGSTPRHELELVVVCHRKMRLNLAEIVGYYQEMFDFTEWDTPTDQLTERERMNLVLMRTMLMQPKIVFLEGEYIELSHHQNFFAQMKKLGVCVISVHKANI